MDERDWLAERFEEQRPRLRAVAYRMLGSVSEADDAVQEAWLRLSRTDTREVENLGAWLTTVVARVSLNLLRSRSSRRETPLGVHVPDPIVDRADGTDPEHEALLADSVGLALLVVLETLSPPERIAFVLHDMFAVPFDEIAPIVDRSPEAARQLASRARRRVQGENAVPDADLDTQRSVADAFLAAARDGDFEALLAVLDPDVVLRADVGPLPAGGSREVRGAREVAGQALFFSGLGLVLRPGTRQRRRRSGLDARRRAVLRRGLHDPGRQDRRNRHPRRPGADRPARPGNPRQLRPWSGVLAWHIPQRIPGRAGTRTRTARLRLSGRGPSNHAMTRARPEDTGLEAAACGGLPSRPPASWRPSHLVTPSASGNAPMVDHSLRHGAVWG